MWVTTDKAITLKGDNTPKVVTHWINTVSVLTTISVLLFQTKKAKSNNPSVT
jgi:hypothetical protein